MSESRRNIYQTNTLSNLCTGLFVPSVLNTLWPQVDMDCANETHSLSLSHLRMRLDDLHQTVLHPSDPLSISTNIFWAKSGKTDKKSSLTRDDDSCSGIDDAAVWPYTVPARRRRLHFETHSSVRRVLQFEVGGDYICERTWWTRNKTSARELLLVVYFRSTRCFDDITTCCCLTL